MAIGFIEIKDSGDPGIAAVTLSPGDVTKDGRVAGSSWGGRLKLCQRLGFCFVLGVACASGLSVALSWLAAFPRLGPVPFAAACERSNTPGTWLVAWVVSSGITFMLMMMGASFQRAGRSLQRRQSWSRTSHEYKKQMAAEIAERKTRDKAAAQRKAE
jgi:hypothetical protein